MWVRLLVWVLMMAFTLYCMVCMPLFFCPSELSTALFAIMSLLWPAAVSWGGA